MKNTFKKSIAIWAIRLVVTGLFSMVLLIGIVLNPSFLYANKTVFANHVVFHNAPIDKNFSVHFNKAIESLKTSPLYNKNIRLEVCLNDGSYYPTLIEKIRGRAFGWGFLDKIVLSGAANYATNSVEVNDYKWNLSQLITHEATHCLQMQYFGFWNAAPIKNHPHWKWEGYPEYIARNKANQVDLFKNITRKIKAAQTDKNGWTFTFEDGMISPRDYYQAWLLIQYCVDLKQMKYVDLLANKSITQSLVEKEMMEWYNQVKRSKQ